MLVFMVVNSFLSSESSRSVRQILLEARSNPVSLIFGRLYLAARPADSIFWCLIHHTPGGPGIELGSILISSLASSAPFDLIVRRVDRGYAQMKAIDTAVIVPAGFPFSQSYRPIGSWP